MTKIFDVVHLNKYTHVTNQVKPEENDWYYDTMQKAIRCGTNNAIDGGYKKKIIASNDSSLKLPLLPAIENEDEITIAIEALNTCLTEAPVDFLGTGSNGKASDEAEKLWYNTWQTAIEILRTAKAKRYTEEDMNRMYAIGYVDGGNATDSGDANKLLQSLNPLPTQVELEMGDVYFTPPFTNGLHDSDPYYDSYTPIKVGMRPIVDENGFVKIKRWIYE